MLYAALQHQTLSVSLLQCKTPHRLEDGQAKYNVLFKRVLQPQIQFNAENCTMPHSSVARSSILSPLKVALIYGIFGVMWIFFSDWILHAIVQNAELGARLQTGKGWFFIFVTAIMVYALTRRLVSSLQEAHDEVQNLNTSLEQRVKARTQDLITSETYLRAVVNSSAEAIVTFDSHGLIETFNPAAQTIFGYREADVIGQRFSTLMPPEKRAAYDDLSFERSRFVQTVVDKPRDFWGQSSDGTVFPIKLNVSKMALEDATKYVGIMHDITERKHMEDRLLSAKTTAERANRAKTDFLSAMSHELRTPLNAIIGFSDSLLHDAFGPINKQEHDVYLGHIKSSGEHLLELINEVLDLAKIESGKAVMAIEDIAPAPIIEDCIDLLAPQAAKHDITIACDLDAMNRIQVRADRMRFKQIVLNLMSNGLKYNTEGGRLSIHCAPPNAAETNMVRFSVTDTGRGISAKDKQTLFVAFNRLDAEERGIPGTGVGLTICKDLVELMQGQIGIDSRLGEGSTFWFDLPSADPSPPSN